MSDFNGLPIHAGELSLADIVTKIKQRARAKFPPDPVAADQCDQKTDLAAGCVHQHLRGRDPNPPVLSELIELNSNAVTNAALEPELAGVVQALLDEARAIEKEMWSALASPALPSDSRNRGHYQSVAKPLQRAEFRIRFTNDGNLIVESVPGRSAMDIR